MDKPEKQDITISFKVDSIVAKELDRRAEETPGASRHTIARRMVYEVLTDAHRHAVVREFAELKEQVQELRFALATAVTALLVQAGKVTNSQDAESWVRKAILGQ